MFVNKEEKKGLQFLSYKVWPGSRSGTFRNAEDLPVLNESELALL
jgi:hypothetical protein